MPLLTKRPLLLKHFDTSIQGDLGAIESITGSTPPSISSAQQRFAGKNSLYLPGLGAKIGLVNSNMFNFGTGNFTIAFSEYLTSATDYACSFSLSATSEGGGGIVFGLNKTGIRYILMSSVYKGWSIADWVPIGTLASCLNVWVDWEISRLGNTIYVFKNGVLIQTVTTNAAIYYSYWDGFYLGWWQIGSSGTSYMAEFAIFDYCLHTANFTPNTEPYTISTDPLAGTHIRSQRIGDISNTKPAVIVGKQRVGVLDTNTKPAIILGKQSIGDRVIPVRLGYKAVDDIKVNRVTPILEGYNPFAEAKQVEKVFIPKQAKVAKIVGTGNVGFRTAIRAGKLLKTLEIDSNASTSVDLLVTPTFTHRSSVITVTAKNPKRTLGRYCLYVIKNGEKDIAVPYQASDVAIDNITFNVPLASLDIGANNCMLEYSYINDDGASAYEYVNFNIDSEAVRRFESRRIFRKYTGGFNMGTNLGILNDVNSIGYLALTDPSSSAVSLLQTTDKTAFSLVGYSSMNSLNIKGSGVRVLLSLDGRETWNKFDGTEFIPVHPGNIATEGMSPVYVNGLDFSNYRLPLNSHLDVMALLDNSKAVLPLKAYAAVTFSTSVHIGWSGNPTGYTYTVPAGYNVYSVAWSFNCTTLEGADNTQNILYATTTTEGVSDGESEVANNIVYKNQVISGTYYPPETKLVNTLRLYGYGRRTYAEGNMSMVVTLYPVKAFIESITLSLPENASPTFVNPLITPTSSDRGIFTVSSDIVDFDEDPISYRVLINGVETIPWTEFAPSPVSLSHDFEYSTLISEQLNIVTLEAQDNLEGMSSQDLSLTYKNDGPIIAVTVCDSDRIAGMLEDPDLDPIHYKVFLINTKYTNGRLIYDSRTYVSSPLNFSINTPNDWIVVGEINTYKIVAEDNVGKVSELTQDFVGDLSGLLFWSPEKARYFSDGANNMLTALDLGKFIVGLESKVGHVALKNRTTSPLNKIKVTSIKVPPGYTILMDKNSSMLDTSDSLDFGINLLQPNEIKDFYVQMQAVEGEASEIYDIDYINEETGEVEYDVDGAFTIEANAEVVELGEGE